MITIKDWENIITQVKEDFVKEKTIEEYNLWIMGIRYIGSDDSKITIELPSKFFKDLIIRKGYLSYVQTKLFEFTQNRFDFDIRINSYEK